MIIGPAARIMPDMFSIWKKGKDKQKKKPHMAGLALLAIIACAAVIFPANAIIRRYVLTEIRSRAEERGFELSMDSPRLNIFLGRFSAELISLSREPGSKITAVDVSITIRVIPYARLALGGISLPAAPIDRMWRVHEWWTFARALEDSGLLPRRFTLGALEWGAESIGFELTHRRNAIALDFAGTSLRLNEAFEVYGTVSLRPSVRTLDGTLSLSSPGAIQADVQIGTEHDGARFPLQGTMLLAPAKLLEAEWMPDLETEFRFKGYADPGAALGIRRVQAQSYPPPPAPRGYIRLEDGEVLVRGEGSLIEGRVDVEITGLFFENPAVAERRSSVLPERVRVDFAGDGIAAQDLLDLVPEDLLGPLSAATVAGNLGGRASVDIPLGDLGGMDWEIDFDSEDFSVLKLPAVYDVFKLAGSFTHRIADEAVDFERLVEIPEYRPASLEWMLLHSERSAAWAQDQREDFLTLIEELSATPFLPGSDAQGDRSYRYVRLDDISRWAISAILTAEDGDFFFHSGLDWNTFSDALARNLAEGDIVLGASTISMQLIKNIFLSSDREFARKVQEILLVYLLEEYIGVPKDRILEIYLNIAEFGPGIFGIYDASAYYFDLHPRDLSAGQAVWLASILPSPKRYHRYYTAGGISPGWFEWMTWNFDTMLKRGRMTEAEHAEATSRIPLFSYR